MGYGKLNIFQKIALAVLTAYKYLISPILGNNCRYLPSCSCYTHTAIERFGVMRGSWMGLKRISRCHPFHPGGLDPVPEIEPEKKND
jgi:putative membrane protein insertion efficiency factor